MTQNQLVSTLKKEAQSDPVFKDTCVMFGARDRARNQVTLSALAARMERHGFKHGKEKYAEVLKRMADLGLGKLETDSKGKVRALRGIDTTLQSIGKAACGEAGSLSKWRKRNRFRALPGGRTEAPEVQSQPVVTPKRRPTTNVDLILKMNDKPIRFELSNDLTAEEIAAIIHKFQER